MKGIGVIDFIDLVGFTDFPDIFGVIGSKGALWSRGSRWSRESLVPNGCLQTGPGCLQWEARRKVLCQRGATRLGRRVSSGSLARLQCACQTGLWSPVAGTGWAPYVRLGTRLGRLVSSGGLQRRTVRVGRTQERGGALVTGW